MACTAFIERYNSRIPVYSRIWTVHIRTRPFFENKEQFLYPKLFRKKNDYLNQLHRLVNFERI